MKRVAENEQVDDFFNALVEAIVFEARRKQFFHQVSTGSSLSQFRDYRSVLTVSASGQGEALGDKNGTRWLSLMHGHS